MPDPDPDPALPGGEQPRIVRSTMDSASGLSWAFAAGATFVQRFRATTGGAPHQLGVRMGANQNPYAVRLRILVEDVVILDRQQDGFVQRTEDWATVFDLSGTGATIRAGDWIEVELTPSSEVGIEPLFLDDPDVPPGDLPGYGAMSARFYLSATPGGEAARFTLTGGARPAGEAALDPHPAGNFPANYTISGPAAVTIHAGERQEWSVDMVDPRVTLTKVVWNVPPSAIAGYDDRQGTIRPYAQAGQLNLSTVFYLPRRGAFELVVDTEADVLQSDGTRQHGAVRKTFSITVNAPTLDATSSEAGDVEVRRISLADLTEKESDGARRVDVLRFQTPQEAGFAMAVWLTRGTAPAGTLRWVQLVHSVREITSKASAGGTTDTWRTPDGWSLDDQVPYEPDEPFSGTELAARQEDSPAQSFELDTERCHVKDQYRMYVMWRSGRAGSIFVTLARFDWMWEGIAIWSAAGGRYILVDLATEYTNQAAPNKTNDALVAADDLPTWVGTCQANMVRTRTPALLADAPRPLADDGPPALPPSRRGPRRDAPSFQNADTALLAALVAPLVHGMPAYTLADAEAWLGRRAGPALDDGGQRYHAMWSTTDRLEGAGFSFVHPAPASLKLADLDLQPQRHPLDPRWYFRVDVAPFCFGDRAYWGRFAHEPLRVGAISDGTDNSLDTFMARLRAVVGATATLRAHEGSWINLGLPAAPSTDLLQHVAALPQCHRVRRWMPDPVVPPGPAPSPSPDVQ